MKAKLVTTLRLALGLLFVGAGLMKLRDPASFQRQIEAYHLIRGMAAQGLAVYLPWLEVTGGLALMTRRGSRPASMVLLGLMLGMTGALVAAWIRGIHIACGCFGFRLDWPPGWLLAKDLIILGALGTAGTLTACRPNRDRHDPAQH